MELFVHQLPKNIASYGKELPSEVQFSQPQLCRTTKFQESQASYYKPVNPRHRPHSREPNPKRSISQADAVNLNLKLKFPCIAQHSYRSHLLRVAMLRPIFADAGSSSDRDERPDSVALSSASSAERPASLSSSAAQPGSPSHSNTLSIRDVQRWMSQEPILSCNSPLAQRLRKAVVVLAQSKPRQEDVQPLQSQWHVAQKMNKKRRSLADVTHEFQHKLISAAKQLRQQLQESAEQPADHGSQPAVQSNTSLSDDSSAAPPASQLDVPQANSEFQVLRACNDWFQTISSQEISNSKPLHRLHTALSLLQSSASREQRQKVQQLFGHWKVSQRKTILTGTRRVRKYHELKADLVVKLVAETHRLQRMQHVANAASPAGGRFSTIQAALMRASVQATT